IQIPEGIKEFIFKYRFKDFLKENQKHHSGDVISRVQQAISSDEELSRKFEEFIVSEISNGKNRQVFLCDFSIESLGILGNTNFVRDCLERKGYPREDFSNFLSKDEFERGEMVYLNIEEQQEGIPSKISMSFMNYVDQDIRNDEGVNSLNKIYTYTWIDIFPVQQYLVIKNRPYADQYMHDLHQSNKVFDHYRDLLQQMFKISFLNMSDSKNVLYNIFKHLTEKAEASYHAVIKEADTEIVNKTTELASLVGLSNIKEPVDLANRISRLLERVLILNDISNYMSYDPDKLGVVDRIDFSDQSGAKVNALSQEEGIEIADIYFDTRETLDEVQRLNKLWVRWFYKLPDREDDYVDQVETRLEVQSDRIIIQFLGVQTAPKEVQDHVLSLFKQFKEGEIS
ncbi:hypothetical protein OCA40_18065, partial [Bacillus cereus]|nr:hypothetical protein [Bacillus cereus]